MANTKTVKKVEQSRERNITVARSNDYGLIYSDTARISISAYDIKVTFSLNETLPDGSGLITEMITIALSPLHAKSLAESLTKNVARYEEQVMSLDINKDFEASHRETIINLKPVSS